MMAPPLSTMRMQPKIAQRRAQRGAPRFATSSPNFGRPVDRRVPTQGKTTLRPRTGKRVSRANLCGRRGSRSAGRSALHQLVRVALEVFQAAAHEEGLLGEVVELALA